MLINNYKKIIGLLGVVMIAVFVFNIPAIQNKIADNVNTAWADDDEEEYDDEDNRVINTAPESNVVQKTETKTIYTKLSDTVSTTTTTITKHDSDGDGMYDEEDPHPTINESFIVKDDNLNGIDDRYEQ
ncbi:MAG: hypothetical protein Q7T51_01595 [Candidatus Moranbacteria bacterium]|nr:hypothetical protein [Candidatus Moranbacteria bacterium]